MLKVDFYNQEISRERIKYVVINAYYKENIVLVKHRQRLTWEIPGGHREKHESAIEGAKREIYEETGALVFSMDKVCVYSVEKNGEVSFGVLFSADIDEIGELPNYEIGEVGYFTTLPKELTYPLIQPKLFKKVLEYRKRC